MSVKNDLVKEFESEVKALGKMELGSEEYESVINGVAKLADRIIEIEKSEQEASFKNISHMNENEIKAAQLAAEKRERIIRNLIETIKVVGGFGLAAWAFVASMNFEREGTISTEGGRSSLRQLLKFIKF